MNDPQQKHYLDIDQLTVGIYVHLDLGWMDHPFPFSNFKIKDDAQIAKIRGMGLKTVRYNPLRSDCEPLPEPLRSNSKPDASGPATLSEAGSTSASSPDTDIAATEAMSESQQRVERLQALQSAIDECEKKFSAASRSVREAERLIHSQPQRAIENMGSMLDDMVESVLTQGDVVIHALNGKHTGDDQYLHSLNTTVLSLMLARTLDLSADEMRQLGLAALFHDVGKIEVPKKILMKTEPLTRSEQSFLQQHSEFGARIARQAGLPESVARIILQHHECMDGTGYPGKLKGDQIDSMSRMLAIVNVYDNLCNPYNVADARTPYEALAYMFATLRSKFDSMILNLLIKSLGVYPPGSIVLLSDGDYGIVVSVNPSKPLRPYIMTYDLDAKSETSIILDLSETPALSISECLRRNQLPDKVLERLNPRKRICYFVDQDNLSKQ